VTQSIAHFDELAALTAALCDGEITSPQAQRLEALASQSEAARWYFLQYVQLHGELYWDHAAAVRAAGVATLPPEQTPFVQIAPRASRGRQTASVGGRWRWIAAAVAASLLATIAWFVVGGLLRDDPRASAAIARLVKTADAQWADAEQALATGEDLHAGRTLDMRSGLAEIECEGGTRLVLQGPTRLTLDSAERVTLHGGRLAARVPPAAAGFTVQTPDAIVVDRGTEFGVSYDERGRGATEIHVFIGAVEVRPMGADTVGDCTELLAGQAVRIATDSPEGKLGVRRMPAAEGLFVRDVRAPAAGSVAQLRQVVAAHPNLIHHYTFEGATRAERCRDKRGDLHLREIIMRDGRGGGDFRETIPGLDGTTNAVAPRRAEQDGNTNGVGLESDAAFVPPPEMTVELLLRFDRLPQAEGSIAAAVATRESERRCGFFVAAANGGRPVQLLDADAAWLEPSDDFVFTPGRWYYVATTFRVEGERTRVSTYVADLGRRERMLTRVVRDELVSGAPPTSRLGVGKAFDDQLTHTYPWAGALDEVAIYNAVLDETTLNGHLRTLVR
jgi:hypothetical protein